MAFGTRKRIEKDEYANGVGFYKENQQPIWVDQVTGRTVTLNTPTMFRLGARPKGTDGPDDPGHTTELEALSSAERFAHAKFQLNGVNGWRGVSLSAIEWGEVLATFGIDLMDVEEHPEGSFPGFIRTMAAKQKKYLHLKDRFSPAGQKAASTSAADLDLGDIEGGMNKREKCRKFPPAR